jgi:FKBP-type peptidyl-prolyl cis-trans isomerase FkpA
MGMRRHRALVLLVALVLGGAGCGDGSSPTEPEDVTFDPSLGIDLSQMTKLESGVYVQTITPGTGTRTLTISDWMAAHYKLWIPNGTLVQQSPPPYNNFVTGSVEGFALGVLGMRVGEVRKIVIPSELGYGESPPGEGIPKNSVLIFEVTLASIG